MISVTLNFKSIEAARAVLLDIPTSALVGAADNAPAKPAPGLALDSGEFIPAAELAKPVEPKAEKAAPAPKTPAAAPVAEASAASTAPQSDTPSTAAVVDYAVLQKAVFTLAGKNKPAALELAAGFGVKTFKDLPADLWAEALAAVNAKIAELG